MQPIGEHPPSPGRWRGVQSTLQVLQGDFDTVPERVSEHQLSSTVNIEDENHIDGEPSVLCSENDLLEPLFSMLSDVHAAEEAEIHIDSLITGKQNNP